jgi:peptide subunit release factor 1 (eRF1)
MAAREPTTLPFLSAYINLNPQLEGGNQPQQRPDEAENDRLPLKSWRRHEDDRRQYRAGVTEMRHLLSEKSDLLPESGVERESFEADAERILEYLKGEFDVSSRGAAIFACYGEDVWQVIELPVAVPTELYVDRQPSLSPLAAVEDAHRRFALCLADGKRAHLWVINLGQAEREETMTGQDYNRTQKGGWSQKRYQRRVDNAISEHVEQVTERLEELVFAEDIPYIVFGGDVTARTEFMNYLSERAQERVVELTDMAAKLVEREAVSRAVEIIEAREREEDDDLVRRAMEEAGGNGLGAVGFK